MDINVKHSPHRLARDIGTVITSIFVAYLLVQTGALDFIITGPKEIKIFGSFIAGFFFTSIFTVAIATVTLAEIALSNNVILVALFGGLGAVIGDFLIFKFLKDHITEDVVELVGHSKRVRMVFRLRLFRFLIPFLGALVIASPLPDEIGLAMMGVVHLKPKYLIPISYFFNTIGILVIGLIANGFF